MFIAKKSLFSLLIIGSIVTSNKTMDVMEFTDESELTGTRIFEFYKINPDITPPTLLFQHRTRKLPNDTVTIRVPAGANVVTFAFEHLPWRALYPITGANKVQFTHRATIEIRDKEIKGIMDNKLTAAALKSFFSEADNPQ